MVVAVAKETLVVALMRAAALVEVAAAQGTFRK